MESPCVAPDTVPCTLCAQQCNPVNGSKGLCQICCMRCAAPDPPVERRAVGGRMAMITSLDLPYVGCMDYTLGVNGETEKVRIVCFARFESLLSGVERTCCHYGEMSFAELILSAHREEPDVSVTQTSSDQ